MIFPKYKGYPEAQDTLPLTYGPPKILVLGHGSHGKGTFTKLLCNKYGYTSSSSSEAAIQIPEIWDVIKAARPEYDSKHIAYAMRREDRELWKTAITLYNTPDKTALCRVILDNYNVYDGMRCDIEYEACKSLFHRVYWVDATERHPDDPTMKIKYDPATMIFINNNGPESDLLRQL